MYMQHQPPQTTRADDAAHGYEESGPNMSTVRASARPRAATTQPSPRNTVRTLLREATHRQHAALHCHPLLSGLTQSGYSLEHYRRLLVAYFHIFQTLEGVIDGFLATHDCAFDYSKRHKVPWLRQDLLFLHAFATDVRDNVNLNAEMPAIRNCGELIGVLYTIEGSTLGGQFICHSLVKNLRLSHDTGARFFYGYGVHSAAMWGDFLYYSDSIADNTASCQNAKLAAGQTFRFFERVPNAHTQPARRTA